MPESQPRYLAIDIETTGLDPDQDIILEIAVLALDRDLAELGEYTRLVSVDPDVARRACSPYVREMHTSNGLLAALAGGGTPLAEIEQTLVQLAGVYQGRPVLCGSSVHFDRRFLRRHLPAFAAKLSHQHLDATTCSLLAPDLRGSLAPAHRALADVRYSVDVLRTARRRLAGGQ